MEKVEAIIQLILFDEERLEREWELLRELHPHHVGRYSRCRPARRNSGGGKW